MFDIGWSELLVIGVVALIVVGPKDLPKLFRTLGEFTGKARRMAREFQTAMNDAADETGVGDIAGDLRKVANPKKFGMDKLREATGDLDDWSPDPGLSPEREAARKKMSDAMGKAATDRKAAEGLVPDPEAAPPAEPDTPETKS